MHIQQIDIDNFKSFSGRTVIPFRRGFTTVSGPNGSGKSNIVDSVLFCLGLSTSRTMRAEKLTDLINNTSRRREATVTITFNRGSQELPDALLQASFSEDEATRSQALQWLETLKDSQLITIARRIKASPSGYTSTYYLNGRPSTLGEVHELLARFNVSPGCYNVMMQGDVAHIVNMSPLERRRIVDELAGVAEFDRKIEQAQKEITTAGDTIERNQVLLREIEGRMEELTQQRNQALRYQELQKQAKTLESQLELTQFKQLATTLQTAQADLSTQTEGEKTARLQHAKLVRALEKHKLEMDRQRERINKQGHGRHSQLSVRRTELTAQQERRQDSITEYQRKIAGAEKAIATIDAETVELETLRTQYQAEVSQANAQLQELQGLLDANKASMAQLRSQQDKLLGADSELQQERNARRGMLEATSDALATLNRQLLDGEAEVQRLQRLGGQQQQALASLQAKQQQLQQRYQNLHQECDTLEANLARLDAQHKQRQQERQRLQPLLAAAQEAWQQQHRRLQRLEAQQQAYEEVSHSRVVDVLLKSGLSGIHGTVAQLARVEPRYHLALEIALGGRVQNLVVDNEQTAQQGIRFLQSKGAGRATFLPLTKIRPFSTRLSALPSGAGVLDYAIDLIDFDAHYQNIFQMALGETLIVDSLEAARPLMNRFRMVTLDGALLEKTGAMTGGSHNQQRRGTVFASQPSAQDAELVQLKQELEALEHEGSKLSKQVQRVEADLTSLQQEREPLRQRLQQVQTTLTLLEQQLNEMDAEARQLTASEGDATSVARMAALQVERASLEAQQATLQAQQAQQQSAVDALHAGGEGDEAAQLTQQLDELLFQNEGFTQQAQHIQLELKRTDTELHIRSESLLKKQAERTDHEAAIRTYQNEITATERDLLQLKEELAAVESELSQMSDEILAMEAELKALQDTLLTLEQEKHSAETLRTRAADAMLTLSAQIRQLEPKVSSLRATLEASLPDLEAQLATCERSVDELEKQLQSLHRRMEGMGDINMLAISDYDAVLERQQDLQTKVGTLSVEQSTLGERIASYESLKLEYFLKAFNSVNEQFQSIYAELSDGYGQLVLTNPEAPLQGGLSIEASPRGKKTQRIEAMSGGEKSLTSLAFVFALQRTMPAPFYALDEVDQNLDGINVEKLSRMIERESATAQFVVVSLRKPMIDNSDRTVGVTQRNNGVSKVTGIALKPERVLDASVEPVPSEAAGG